mmetsp:Transcript_95794/g.132908  ORF Transcript_95794/g.132908 Transcript_95794/m.132908 type:complete len:214 (+) Transcript_95794:251-892(+)
MVRPSGVLVMPETTLVKPSSSTCVSFARRFFSSSRSSYCAIQSSISCLSRAGSGYSAFRDRSRSLSIDEGGDKTVCAEMSPVAASSAFRKTCTSLKTTRAKTTCRRTWSARCSAFGARFSTHFSSTFSTGPKEEKHWRICDSVVKASKWVAKSVLGALSFSAGSLASCFLTRRVLVIGEPGDIGTRRSLYPRTSSELGDVEASVFFRTMAAKT